ncbi:hypothetical protein RAC89_31205 [Paenibacillus sp. GD4]|nr:hypothetical protein [Paenibacillus sp. GD4]
MAETAVSKLIELKENEGASITSKIHIDTKLIVRNSTCAHSS